MTQFVHWIENVWPCQSQIEQLPYQPPIQWRILNIITTSAAKFCRLRAQSIEMMLFCYRQPIRSFPLKTSGWRYFWQHNIYKIWRGSDESQVEWRCDSERDLRWFVVFWLISGLKGLEKCCVHVLNSWRNLSPWLDPEKTKYRKWNKNLTLCLLGWCNS